MLYTRLVHVHTRYRLPGSSGLHTPIPTVNTVETYSYGCSLSLRFAACPLGTHAY